MSRVLSDKQYEIIGKAMNDYYVNRVNTKLSLSNSNVNDIDVVSAEQFYAVARNILEYMDFYNRRSSGE